MTRTLSEELLDAGKRIKDQLDGVLAFNDPFDIKDKWMAFALSDGQSRGEVFDTILDAKRFTDESRTWYLCLGGALQGLSARDCSIMLQFHREARDAGLGQSDPKRQPFMSTAEADMRRGNAPRSLWTPN